MKNNEINQTSVSGINATVVMNDEREAWSMWDPAIPAELCQQYLAA